jgi:hypothetical protein
MRGEQPLVEGHMATLHHRSGANGELVATVIAEPVTGLSFAAHEGDALAATMRTFNPLGPTGQSNMLLGLGFVVEDRIGDVHGFLLKPLVPPICC